MDAVGANDQIVGVTGSIGQHGLDRLTVLGERGDGQTESQVRVIADPTIEQMLEVTPQEIEVPVVEELPSDRSVGDCRPLMTALVEERQPGNGVVDLF